jgi:hypothetical protein
VHIFGDRSGELSDTNPTVLVIVFYFTSQIPEVNARLSHLKIKVEDCKIDTNKPNFEFHAEEMFNNKGYWHGLNDTQIDEIANGLVKTILHHHLHYALILVDKVLGGTSGVEKFRKDMISQRKLGIKEAGKLIDQSIINEIEAELQKVYGNTGTGTIGYLTSALFGLVNNYIDTTDFKGKGITKVDDQYLHANKLWPHIFKLSNIAFPYLLNDIFLPHLPLNKPIDWHLGESVTEESSINYIGIQLADYIAYTTLHMIQGKDDLASKNAVISKIELRPFFNYQGITFGTSYFRYNDKDFYRPYPKRKSAR